MAMQKRTKLEKLEIFFRFFIKDWIKYKLNPTQENKNEVFWSKDRLGW